MSIVRRLSERIRKSFRRRPRPGYSTADTVDARPVKKGCIRCKIALLDGSDLTIDVEVTNKMLILYFGKYFIHFSLSKYLLYRE